MRDTSVRATTRISRAPGDRPLLRAGWEGRRDGRDMPTFLCLDVAKLGSGVRSFRRPAFALARYSAGRRLTGYRPGGLASSCCLSRFMFSGISLAAWRRTMSGTRSFPIP